MSSVRIGQDLPPEGGFAPITYKKRLPKLGPPGWAIFLGVGLFMGAGIYKKTMDNRQFRACDVEKQWAKIYLSPLLQAEEDRKYLRWEAQEIAKEKEIFGDQAPPPGVLHSTKKWYPPIGYTL